MGKKKMTFQEYVEKWSDVIRKYRLKLIKTGQEAKALLNELETEFTGKKR